MGVDQQVPGRDLDLLDMRGAAVIPAVDRHAVARADDLQDQIIIEQTCRVRCCVSAVSVITCLANNSGSR